MKKYLLVLSYLIQCVAGARISILIEGWINIPHSYAIVNCLQSIHLIKHYGDRYAIFVSETPYFVEKWANAKSLTYSEQYNKIIRGLRPWRGEQVDLIYRISYPIDISIQMHGLNIPILVFYTSFGYIPENEFVGAIDMTVDAIQEHIKENQNLHFIAPSNWSSIGLQRYISPDEWGQRQSVITHGVDLSIFHRDVNLRRETRLDFGLQDNDIVFLNIGAMTSNKGIRDIFLVLNSIIEHGSISNVKLLLKGTGDLYSSQGMVLKYFKDLEIDGQLNEEDATRFMENHLIFTDKTYTFEQLNGLYNAADAYLSPYMGEGFNLPVLEAVAIGLPVFVTNNGSTAAFISDILSNVTTAKHHIFPLPTQPIYFSKDHNQNYYRIVHDECQDVIEKHSFRLGKPADNKHYKAVRQFLQQHYSWDSIAHVMHKTFQRLLNNTDHHNDSDVLMRVNDTDNDDVDDNSSDEL